MKYLRLVLPLVLGFGISASAVAAGASTLDDLLRQVKSDKSKEHVLNNKREAEFVSAKDKQASLLKAAKARLKAEEARGAKIKSNFDSNEKQLSELEEKLRMTMGTLGELFGVVKQVAGDTKGVFENSIISAEHTGRVAFVDMLGRRKKLPNTAELRELWYGLQKEMTESGKVTQFKAMVTGLDGKEVEKLVTRIGTFNLVADGRYIRYLPEVSKLAELGRQPQDRYLSLIEDFEGSKEPLAAIGIDPSRGTILSLLVQAPSLWEKYQQGGLVGWVITGVMFIGMLLTLERLFVLGRIGKRMSVQMLSKTPILDNPLGQILNIYELNKDKDLESLELKLDEAIMKNTNNLDRGIPTIKILAAVAPLLGLLGTVTGMIGTFQAITLFGTGDPKLMAGGISQALVTTVLGLVAAIPLVLMHSFVSNRSKSVMTVLEEQSTGMMAERAELEGAK
jgi:biopolymer transport protein ExbB